MSFNVGTIREVVRAVEELPRNKDKFTKDVINDLLNFFLREVKEKAPAKTGAYAQSWKKAKVTATKGQIETPEGELFIILEFQGRDAGRIDAKDNVLAFIWRNAEVFFKFVNHPGFEEMPHVRPALRKTKKEFPKIFKKNLKKHFRLFK